MMAEIPEWAMDRACAEAGFTHQFIPSEILKVFAAYIAKHETPPVDPKVEAMRAALNVTGWATTVDGTELWTDKDLAQILRAYESKLTELGAKP